MAFAAYLVEKEIFKKVMEDILFATAVLWGIYQVLPCECK